MYILKIFKMSHLNGTKYLDIYRIGELILPMYRKVPCSCYLFIEFIFCCLIFVPAVICPFLTFKKNPLFFFFSVISWSLPSRFSPFIGQNVHGPQLEFVRPAGFPPPPSAAYTGF